jgi:hypothetical protein
MTIVPKLGPGVVAGNGQIGAHAIEKLPHGLVRYAVSLTDIGKGNRHRMTRPI